MPFIGIDVAKAQFEFACLPSGGTGTVPHDDRGLRELVARCQALTPTLIVLGATGGYEAALVAALASSCHGATRQDRYDRCPGPGALRRAGAAGASAASAWGRPGPRCSPHPAPAAAA